MALSIRNPEADALARRLAQLDETSITDAVSGR
ncbi:type II toxin-antitoxin system VapB family antitoxin [Sphingomonas lycopersici]|uniref:Type II toxin-antitoxin system VapB family antitoxin n=1 Tax=Sphingomonas lycopersici TaxID=2951807 RepID=A0AA42CS55_9SPHN|nr:type II toxin-antitoxin system VapB family antitoxin [Sphingomonas lycopersici]MCW6536944.1 type II toxin-antitoxin system VapB family antitoxin [Sphingomonas lycopersici]